MSKAPSMPMFWDAYLADTTHLTTEEHGAYLLLLAAMWRRNGSVPDDDQDNARILGLTPGRWRKIKSRLSDFLEFNDGQITQKNLRKIWEKTQEKIETNRKNGARGGRPKSKENSDLGKANGSNPRKPIETIPEPEPYLDDDEDSAGEIFTFREQILEAIGVDPSGLVDPSGKMIGTQADMAEANRWLTLPGISEQKILAEIRTVMSRRLDGPPGTFRYFTPAIQSLSGALNRPDLTPISGGNYDQRSSNSGPQQRRSCGHGSATVDAFAEVARRRAQGGS